MVEWKSESRICSSAGFTCTTGALQCETWNLAWECAARLTILGVQLFDLKCVLTLLDNVEIKF